MEDPNIPLLLQHESEALDKLFQEEDFMADSTGYLRNQRAATLRGYAVSFIEKYSKCDNFDAFVPYLAMNYFDRLISRHQIERLVSNEKENENLFVLCCLTIASKMRTKSFKLPKFMELESCKLVLQNLCNAKLDALTIPATEETSGKASSSAAGISGASSSSLPPQDIPRGKSKPMQIGGDPSAVATKREISRSLPPGADVEESDKPVGEIQPDPTPEPAREIQPGPTPEPVYREDLQMDFALEWTDPQAPKLVVVSSLPQSQSLLHKLTGCCPIFTAGDSGNDCFIL